MKTIALLPFLIALPLSAQLPSSGISAGGLSSGAVMQGLTGGGTQCVQVNNNGVPSGTGAACGSGSGGNPIAGTKAQPYVAPSTGTSVIPVNTPLYLDALQLGATPDVAINLCTIGAFCDARSFGPASYTTTSQITVGNTSGGAETLMLPTGGLRPSSLGSWTSNATGGTSTTLFQYGGSTITGTPNSGLGNQFRLRAGTGSALSHIYQTAAGANGENYFYACCMTVENISGTGAAVTSGNAGSLISGSADASVWEYMGFFDALDTYDLELANNCCGPTIRSSQINANYGGTPLHVITGAGQGGGPYNLNEVSIVHPGSGVYALLQSDTSPHSTILNLNNVYTETSTTNCTFGIFSISGAKSVNLHNWDAQANCSGMSSPGITIANVGTTGAHFDGLTFANGTGDWFLPVGSAIVDNYRGITAPSDANGHVGMYDNSVTYSWHNYTTGSNADYEATIASAATIAPTRPTMLVTGTTPINTMTPPVGCTTSSIDCYQTLVADPATGPFTITQAGNFYAPSSPTIAVPIQYEYRPATSKWYQVGSFSGSRETLNVLNYGAKCNGSSNTALANGYSTLTALQAVYSFATATSNQMDWLAAQKALNSLPSTGGTVQFPNGTCIFDQTLVKPTSSTFPGDAPSGGNYIVIKGAGAGTTFIQPTADLGTNHPLISCGDPSATPNLTTGIGTGRYANAGCPGSEQDLSLVMPYTTIATFGVAPTISGTPVAMDGIYIGTYESLYRVNVYGFLHGINLVGNHQTLFETNSNHNYCGLYFAPQNVDYFGDIIMPGSNEYGGNSMAGVCVDKDAYMSVPQGGGEIYVGHEPYGILKLSGTPDAYVGDNVFMSANSFQKVQCESIGNACIWDDNLTQSGGGINGSPASGGSVNGTFIDSFFSSYQATYNVTAGGRNMYAFVGLYDTDSMMIRSEQGSWLNSGANSVPAALLYGLYTQNVGFGNGGLVISAVDLDTALAAYGSVPFAANEAYDYANNYIQLINPGRWEGRELGYYGTATLTTGQVVSGNDGNTIQLSNGTLPVQGVVMQTTTAGSGAENFVAIATSGQAVPVTLAGATTANVGQPIIANASGTSAPLVNAGGWRVGTLVNYTGTNAGVLDLEGLGSYQPTTNTFTTSSLGGSALAAGACSTTTVTVTGATTSQNVTVTPTTYPGAPYYWKGYVSATGTVTVAVCAATAGTPTASVYHVRVQ